MQKKIGALLVALSLTTFLLNLSMAVGQFLPAADPPLASAAGGLPPLPSGLKSTFLIGIANGPDIISPPDSRFNLAWLLDTRTRNGANWDARYQYLTGGVNTANTWKYWNWPDGQFALNYMSDSYSTQTLPVFTYYNLLKSLPAATDPSLSTERDKDFANLNNSSTMGAYFIDFKLLLTLAGAFGKPVVVHVEPDLWAYLQQLTRLKNPGQPPNPNNLSAAVASSNFADVAGYPNTVAGFARALAGLRDKYAPNVILAYHISTWAGNGPNLSTSKDSTLDVAALAQETANFYNQMGANFDLLFYDIADQDAATYTATDPPSETHWWNPNNTTFPNFNRFNQFVAAVTTATGKRGILWQVPVGNTIYLSENNTPHHWQDDRVQYYLGGVNNDNQHLLDLDNSGLVGVLFGPGNTKATSYDDSANDGLYNPDPLPAGNPFGLLNNIPSSYPDDDGGNLRLQGGAYYTRGRLSLYPAGSPIYSSSIMPGNSINLGNSSGATARASFLVNNTGAQGSTLAVSSLTLTGSGADVFSLSSSAPFSMIPNSSPQTITINCTPVTGGTLGQPHVDSAILTVSSNDPLFPTLQYYLKCIGPVPNMVTSIYDSGTEVRNGQTTAISGPGSLSYALLNYQPGQAITFNLDSGNTVYISGALPPVPQKATIDGGSCAAGNSPRITLEGSTLTENSPGLTLNGGVTLKNLRLLSLGKYQLQAKGSGNQFLPGACVVLTSHHMATAAQTKLIVNNKAKS